MKTSKLTPAKKKANKAAYDKAYRETKKAQKAQALVEYITTNYSQKDIEWIIENLPRLGTYVLQIAIKEYDHKKRIQRSFSLTNFYNLREVKKCFKDLVASYKKNKRNCYIVAQGQGWYDVFEQ